MNRDLLRFHLTLHKDDTRNVCLFSNLPAKRFITQRLKKDLIENNIYAVTIIDQDGKPHTSEIGDKLEGKKKLVIHHYPVSQTDFHALAELSTQTSNNYPTAMYCTGDGSLNDALSLMIAHTGQYDENQKSFILPVQIVRSHMKTFSQELSKYCQSIKEDTASRFYDYCVELERLCESEDPDSNKRDLVIAELVKLVSDENLKIGLIRLSRFLEEEKNLSRQLPKTVEDILFPDRSIVV